MFTQLGSIAAVSLGYKSLQNDFFYVNQATVDTYGIEKKYLMPMLMLKDLDSLTYKQNPQPKVWLFACRESRADLGGSGAWRYIEAMADRSAAKKKQAGKDQTIREALEAQGGGLWYAPKARPNKHHIWLRKAFNSIYSPFLFDEATLVDQRLNSISPHEGINWRELAAALTSSVFAYGLEINGSASMGAGALEAPTTKLRDFPILDVTKLSPSDRSVLVGLAEAVWSELPPLDWDFDERQPGANLRELDAWTLRKAGRDLSVERMYSDIRATCQARISVAQDKKKKIKKRESDSIGSVADSIVRAIEPKLKMKLFPEDFADGARLDLPLVFDRASLKEISVSRLLDIYDVEVYAQNGTKAYSGNHPRPVAEAIIRALLMGRSTFSVSTDRKSMDDAVNRFLAWFRETDEDIAIAIAESALGTGYEDALRKEIYSRLGIHPFSGAESIPEHIQL